MGSSPSEPADTALPDFRLPADVYPSEPPEYMPPPRHFHRRPEPVTRYIILFLLTVVTTTWVGLGRYAFFISDFGVRQVDLSLTQLIFHGFWYSVSILGILGAHEFGHYFACRYYDVDASLPYFLPVPPPFFTGTFGAVIRIREPIATKRALFDIGIAGPIAGFVVAVPLLFIGMHLSTIVASPAAQEGLVEIGEPLLVQAAEHLTFGTIKSGFEINLHPMAFAAWFGLLATALNLFPIGQLDGGHISYAVLGRKSTIVTFSMVGCLVALTIFVSTSSWLVWTVLTLAMLVTFGPRHPRTFDEHEPLDRARLWLALFAVIMFILCFTPAPIEPIDIVGGR